MAKNKERELQIERFVEEKDWKKITQRGKEEREKKENKEGMKSGVGRGDNILTIYFFVWLTNSW